MRVLPVIDLKAGLVVRGVGGNRHEYQPIASRIVSSALPVPVARAYREAFGLHELYLADLDAIAGMEPSWQTYSALENEGFQLWVDAGLAAGTVERLASLGVPNIVAGLESMPGPDALAELLLLLGPERVVFSLDMKAAQPLGDSAGWSIPDPFEIACHAIRLGIARVIVLDLASVGAGEGVPTLALCKRLQERFPNVQQTSGGGVRDVNDLKLLKQTGVACALVASALHDGRIARADIEAVADSSIESPSNKRC